SLVDALEDKSRMSLTIGVAVSVVLDVEAGSAADKAEPGFEPIVLTRSGILIPIIAPSYGSNVLERDFLRREVVVVDPATHRERFVALRHSVNSAHRTCRYVTTRSRPSGFKIASPGSFAPLRT